MVDGRVGVGKHCMFSSAGGIMYTLLMTPVPTCAVRGMRMLMAPVPYCMILRIQIIQVVQLIRDTVHNRR